MCLSSKEPCFCGNSNFSYDDGKWCCATNCTGGCHRWEEGYKEGDDPDDCLEWQPGNCTTGVALNLTESCGQSHRCNYPGQHIATGYRDDSRSYVAACANTSTCIKERTICTGDSSCEGELDWCRGEERKEEKCFKGFIRCPGIGSNGEGRNGTKSIPGQCIDQAKARTGEENNCLDRSDEDPFQEAANARNKETIIDYGSLKNCTKYESFPGLECGDSNSSNCIAMYEWCNDVESSECPVLGKGIRTNDPTLCANISFWRKLSCEEDQIRCQAGKSGQCMSHKHWGVEGLGLRDCSDGSDLSRPIKQPTETEDPASKAVQANFNEHEQRINNGGVDNVAGEEEKPLKLGAADKRGSAEARGGRQSPPETEEDYEYTYEYDYYEYNYKDDCGKPPAMVAVDKRGSAEGKGGQQSQPQVWRTEPVTEEDYNCFYKGKEEGAKYVKDAITGLWMVAVSEETCKASQGFVCKVRLCTGCFHLGVKSTS